MIRIGVYGRWSYLSESDRQNHENVEVDLREEIVAEVSVSEAWLGVVFGVGADRLDGVMNFDRSRGFEDGFADGDAVGCDVVAQLRVAVSWKVQESGTTMRTMSCADGGGCTMAS
jgi:hypothetical protein